MTIANTTAPVSPITIAELDLAPLESLLESSIIVETHGEYLSFTELEDFAREFDSALATVIPTLTYERVRQPLESARTELQKVIEPNTISFVVILVTVLIARNELKRIVHSIGG